MPFDRKAHFMAMPYFGDLGSETFWISFGALNGRFMGKKIVIRSPGFSALFYTRRYFQVHRNHLT